MLLREEFEAAVDGVVVRRDVQCVAVQHYEYQDHSVMTVGMFR